MNGLTIIPVTEIFQTEIKDKWASKLCMWLCEMWMAWSIMRFISSHEYQVIIPALTKHDLNRLNNECIAKGGLKKLTAEDSDNGFVLNHEINAACVGLTGYKKLYEPIGDASKVINLVQWGIICELRDEGKHSMMAVGTYEETGEIFIKVFDPWKATNDRRFNCKTRMTQRRVNGVWTDSRSVESFAWYYKLGTEPKWVM